MRCSLRPPSKLLAARLVPPAGIPRFLLAAATALATTISCGGRTAATKPAPVDGIFLIVIDTLRPDRLSCYGFQGHQTAAMDRIAASGARFENAESPAS